MKNNANSFCRIKGTALVRFDVCPICNTNTFFLNLTTQIKLSEHNVFICHLLQVPAILAING